MPKYDPHKHHRRSIRLKGYDYSRPGYYFVTICTQDRACLFGKCNEGLMRLNPAGEMVQDVWLSLPERFPHIRLDAFVIMPNHVHFVVEMVVRAGTRPAPTLGDVVQVFKSLTTHRYSVGVKEEFWEAFNRRLWQRNYYEKIIRNGRALIAVREYILHNPQNWMKDGLCPHSQ